MGNRIFVKTYFINNWGGQKLPGAKVCSSNFCRVDPPLQYIRYVGRPAWSRVRRSIASTVHSSSISSLQISSERSRRSAFHCSCCLSFLASFFHLCWRRRGCNHLYPVTEHRHPRLAALGAGIEHKGVPAVLHRIYLVRVQRFNLLNGIGVYNALHVRKNNGIAL